MVIKMATNSNDMYRLSLTNWEYGYQPKAKFQGFAPNLDTILKYAVEECKDIFKVMKSVIIQRKTLMGTMHGTNQKVYEWRPVGVVARVETDWPDNGYGYRYIWIPYGGAGRDITPKSLIKKKTVRRR